MVCICPSQTMSAKICILKLELMLPLNETVFEDSIVKEITKLK